MSSPPSPEKTSSPDLTGKKTPSSPAPASPTPAPPAPASPTPASPTPASPSKFGSLAGLTKRSSKGSKPPVKDEDEDDEGWQTRPDFIYGGPFISYAKPSPFLDTATPMNIQLQGTFKKSFAYFSLKERMPVILTKIIDKLSRDDKKIKSANSATDEDIRSFMQYVTKLKNDLVTNKEYDPLTVDTPNAKKWNDWIADQDMKKYFNNTWLFTECYVYRRLKEGCELTKGLKNFDYFKDQKDKSFDDNLQFMCVVADRVVTMLPVAPKDKRKQDFITLLKLSLWANKCDLSLSLGESVSMIKEKAEGEVDKAAEVQAAAPPPPAKKKGKKGKKADEPPVPPANLSSDPFQMILELKNCLLVDESAKIADQVVAKAEKMLNNVNKAAAATVFKAKCSCQRLAIAAGMPICTHESQPVPPPPSKDELKKKKGKAAPPPPPPVDEEKKEGEEEKKPIPCPAKMTVPKSVMFDIVCDNAGYELFADLCLAHFLIAQKIVQKVRFHVKNIPWFVSDVTEKDFHHTIKACCNAQFSKELPPVTNPQPSQPKPADAPPDEAKEETRLVQADNLRALGEQWKQLVDDGVFLVIAEDYWTYPHSYKDMKKYDYNMYRKLQYAVAVLWKGDLNYRKLLGERNCNPYIKLEEAMQGFLPAPTIALRCVKSELICGLPKGKWDQLNGINAKWMQSGDYGVIQYCPKAEPLKVADRPCIDYCETCFGLFCSDHTADM